MGKKLVDVEDLMVWAADELSRKRPPQSQRRAPLDLGSSARELVGKWDRPMGYPTVSPMFAPGFGRGGFGAGRGEPPHPDALIVEQAIERLRLADYGVSASIETWLTYGLGFSVDTAGALRAALFGVADLLIVHGRLASRPSLHLGPPTSSPARAPNGKPGVWRRERWAEATFGENRADSERDVEVACPPKRRDLYPTGAYCRLDWDPGAQALVNERAEYSAWRAGLAWLAEELSGRLESRAPLSPRAAMRPWAGERDGEPVRDLFGPAEKMVFGPEDAASLSAERRYGRRRPTAGGNVYAGRPMRPAKGEREA